MRTPFPSRGASTPSGVLCTAVWLAATVCACGSSERGVPTAQLRLGMPLSVAGVTGVTVTIDCLQGFSSEQYAALEVEGLPRHVGPDFAGQPFADLFAVLPVDVCTITAMAMTTSTDPADHCAPATVTVALQAVATTEVLLAIECQPPDQGAVDIVTTLNHAPVVTSATWSPDTTVAVGVPVTLVVGVEDLDGDTVEVTFETLPPDGAVYTGQTKGLQWTLQPQTPGTYGVRVTVDDGQLATDALFEVQVTP
jgi:hypothetical protein